MNQNHYISDYSAPACHNRSTTISVWLVVNEIGRLSTCVTRSSKTQWILIKLQLINNVITSRHKFLKTPILVNVVFGGVVPDKNLWGSLPAPSFMLSNNQHGFTAWAPIFIKRRKFGEPRQHLGAMSQPSLEPPLGRQPATSLLRGVFGQSHATHI